MERAIIDKTIIDMLIRAKLATLGDCRAVEALPVSWQPPVGAGCNWSIPGWIGETQAVQRCSSRFGQYLAFLQSQFNIPDEGHGEPRRRQGPG